MVTLTVTETRFGRPYSTFALEAPRKTVVIDALTREYPDRRFDPAALCALLTMHDDLRLAGPTWDVRFEFSFKP